MLTEAATPPNTSDGQAVLHDEKYSNNPSQSLAENPAWSTTPDQASSSSLQASTSGTQRESDINATVPSLETTQVSDHSTEALGTLQSGSIRDYQKEVATNGRDTQPAVIEAQLPPVFISQADTTSQITPQSAPPSRPRLPIPLASPEPVDIAHYRFGSIQGVSIGTVFDSRKAASDAGIHKAGVKGIVGSQDVGCTSICVNGGYDDNIDLSYSLVYTGDGGKAPTTAHVSSHEQGEDQTWTPMNRALWKSFQHSRPIRVLRGSKSKAASAPLNGYRYDGLYQIVRCYIARSVRFGGYKVIRFALQRLPNQIPIRRGSQEFPEPSFIREPLLGNWLEMPQHSLELRPEDRLLEPTSVFFADQYGNLTPAELARRRMQDGDGKPPVLGGPVRTSSVAREARPVPYVPRPPRQAIDSFGNPIKLATATKAELPPKPQIENVDFHKVVNLSSYKQLFTEKEKSSKTRGYMAWRTVCFEDQTVYQDLDDVERRTQEMKAGK